jgi:hypothetical protein
MYPLAEAYSSSCLTATSRTPMLRSKAPKSEKNDSWRSSYREEVEYADTVVALLKRELGIQRSVPAAMRLSPRFLDEMKSGSPGSFCTSDNISRPESPKNVRRVRFVG